MTLLVGFDWESYYKRSNPNSFSLTNLTTEAYVRDSRFEPLCLGVAVEGQEPFAVEQESLMDFLHGLPWNDMVVIHHHAQFDGLILSHHFGFKPKMFVDTISLARTMLPRSTKSFKLEKLALQFGLEPKNVPYNLFEGKHWEDLSPETKALVMAGAAHDAELSLQLFHKLIRVKPGRWHEPVKLTDPITVTNYMLKSMDWPIRCFTDPKLEGDANTFFAAAEEEAARKEEMLAALGVTRKDLASTPIFANLLKALDVELEFKLNPKGDKKIPALAKTDSFMQSLLEHDDPLIQALAEARCSVRSTIRETRAWRFGTMAERGLMCLYYHNNGAHTTRLSGGDKVNAQNVERKGPLRSGFKAAKGRKLIIIDQSQVEARLVNTLSGQWDVVEKFAKGVDIYCENASQLYGFPVTKEKHPAQRGTGKQIELSCGFGCGGEKFVLTAKLGIYGPPVEMTLDEGIRAVRFYRKRHPKVCLSWDQGSGILNNWAANGFDHAFEFMGCYFENGICYLPDDFFLDFSTVEYDPLIQQHMVQVQRPRAKAGKEKPTTEAELWKWYYSNGYRKIYGSKLVENLIQAHDAVLYRRNVHATQKALNLLPVLSSHDEAVYEVPEAEADYFAHTIHEVWTQTVDYMPQFPIAAEYRITDNYGKE